MKKKTTKGTLKLCIMISIFNKAHIETLLFKFQIKATLAFGTLTLKGTYKNSIVKQAKFVEQKKYKTC